MAQVFLFPATGESPLDEDGNPFPVTGLRVTMNAYYEGLCRSGLLKERDPGGTTNLVQPAVYAPVQLATVVTSLSSYSITRDKQRVVVDGWSTAGDFAQGLEYRAVLNSSATVDEILTLSAPNGRWCLVWDGVTLPARAAGVRADVKTVSDGVTTTSSAVLTSATAAFTQADVGKIILLETPSSPCTGTVTVSTSSTRITGSGTLFDSECVNGLSLLFRIGDNYYGGTITSDTDIAMDRLALASVAGATMYRQTQLRTTIASVQSATQCTLSDVITVGGTGVVFRFGSDDTDRLDSAMRVASAAGARVLQLPAGYIGVVQNKYYESFSDLHIRGAGMFSTVVQDLRMQSEDLADDNPAHPWAPWDFADAVRVTISDLTVDGALPGSGIRGHSSDSGSNIGGIRKGITFDGSGSDITLERLGIIGHGVQEEQYFFAGTYPRVTVRGIRSIGASNSNALNFNSGNITAIVDDCELDSAYTSLNSAAGELLCTNCVFRGAPATTDTVAIDVSGRNTITNCRWESIQMVSGTTPISFFGTPSDDAVLVFANNRFEHFQCAANLTAGVVTLQNFRGTADIYGNLCDGVYCDNSTPAQSRKFIYISGASMGGKINIGNNVIRGRFLGSPYPGSWAGLNTGVYVETDVDDGVVVWSGKLTCEGSVATPLSTTKALSSTGTSNLQQTISSTGTTDVIAGVQAVIVTANGAVTARLPSAVLFKSMVVPIVNDSTQAGTTTVSAVAGSIIGTTSLVGAAAKATYISNGTKWFQVA